MGSEEEFKRGRFEGEVMSRLDNIGNSIQDFKLIFAKHGEDDEKAFSKLHSRLNTLERRYWMLAGAAAVVSVLWAILQPSVAQAISKLFQN